MTERTKELRGFGLVMAAAAALLAAWARSPYLAAAALAFLGAAALRPRLLAPLHGPWMRLAGILGEINAFILLSAIYYLIMTPYAIVLRLLGRDPLDRRLRTAQSYWKTRSAADTGGYRHQF